MSDKFYDVIAKIMQNPREISPILFDNMEYYFKFKGHTFSIAQRDDDNEFGKYSVFIYPQWNGKLEDLVAAFSRPEANPPYMAYHSVNLRPDKRMQFQNLYRIVESVYLKIDDVFDDILKE